MLSVFLRIYDGFTDMVSYESDSNCDSGEYATGMTVWASDAYVYGITLECVAVTDTCVPPNYPASLQEGASSESDIALVEHSLMHSKYKTGAALRDCIGGNRARGA